MARPMWIVAALYHFTPFANPDALRKPLRDCAEAGGVDLGSSVGSGTMDKRGGGGGGGGGEELELNQIDAEDPEISDYNMIPDTLLMSDRLRTCLQESDEVPSDFTRLFKTR